MYPSMAACRLISFDRRASPPTDPASQPPVTHGRASDRLYWGPTRPCRRSSRRSRGRSRRRRSRWRNTSRYCAAGDRRPSHAVEQAQHQAERVVAVEQQPQVQEGLRGGQAVADEDPEGEDGDEGLDQDLARVEPVEPLATRQHELDTGDGGGERQEAGPVEP